MKDERGLYYYPVLDNKNIKMYVRLNIQDKSIEFRMWDDQDPKLWEEHGWVPWPVIQQAAQLYKEEYKKDNKNKLAPLSLYDIDIALRLIKDDIEDNM